jgi:biopolymer transport protein ExbD
MRDRHRPAAPGGREMKLTRRKPPNDKIKMNMTPMIDIVFLLIVFFMCVSELSKREIESITLPEAVCGTDQPRGDAPRMIVNVMPDGEYRVEGSRLSLEQLRNLITRRAIVNQDEEGRSWLAVKIRADAYVPYKYVQAVLLGCQSARVWQLSFGVAPRQEGRIQS